MLLHVRNLFHFKDLFEASSFGGRRLKKRFSESIFFPSLKLGASGKFSTYFI